MLGGRGREKGRQRESYYGDKETCFRIMWHAYSSLGIIGTLSLGLHLRRSQQQRAVQLPFKDTYTLLDPLPDTTRFILSEILEISSREFSKVIVGYFPNNTAPLVHSALSLPPLITSLDTNKEARQKERKIHEERY